MSDPKHGTLIPTKYGTWLVPSIDPGDEDQSHFMFDVNHGRAVESGSGSPVCQSPCDADAPRPRAIEHPRLPSPPLEAGASGGTFNVELPHSMRGNSTYGIRHSEAAFRLLGGFGTVPEVLSKQFFANLSPETMWISPMLGSFCTNGISPTDQPQVSWNADGSQTEVPHSTHGIPAKADDDLKPLPHGSWPKDEIHKAAADIVRAAKHLTPAARKAVRDAIDLAEAPLTGRAAHDKAVHDVFGRSFLNPLRDGIPR